MNTGVLRIFNELPINQVLCGDCLKVLRQFPENSIDLILTDPPYNIASKNKITFKSGGATTTEKAWGNTFNDEYSETDYEVFMLKLSVEFDRILCDNGSIIIFFDRGKPYYLKPFYSLFHFRNMVTFVKKNPSPHVRKNNYRSTFEQCAWFSRDSYYINFISQRKMKNVIVGLSGNLWPDSSFNVNMNPKQSKHPTEKYEWMIYPLIERHSKPGDVVLDPMCGSGSTLSCAKKLNRNYIGIDIDPQWVQASVDRVKKMPETLYGFMEVKTLDN